MISTENGFWKFFMKDDLGKYVLYHRNVYEIKNSHYDSHYEHKNSVYLSRGRKKPKFYRRELK